MKAQGPIEVRQNSGAPPPTPLMAALQVEDKVTTWPPVMPTRSCHVGDTMVLVARVLAMLVPTFVCALGSVYGGSHWDHDSTSYKRWIGWTIALSIVVVGFEFFIRFRSLRTYVRKQRSTPGLARLHSCYTFFLHIPIQIVGCVLIYWAGKYNWYHNGGILENITGANIPAIGMTDYVVLTLDASSLCVSQPASANSRGAALGECKPDGTVGRVTAILNCVQPAINDFPNRFQWSKLCEEERDGGGGEKWCGNMETPKEEVCVRPGDDDDCAQWAVEWRSSWPSDLQAAYNELAGGAPTSNTFPAIISCDSGPEESVAHAWDIAVPGIVFLSLFAVSSITLSVIAWK